MTVRCAVATLATVFVLLLQGCAAVQTAVSHSDLDVQNRMSETIFLDPVGPDKKVVFVQAKNTSDQPGFDLEPALKQAIAAKGYQIVDDPNRANYILQVNVLQVGKVDPSAAEQSFLGGYGSAATGAGVGAAAGALAGGTTAVLGGALAGGLVSVVADAAVKNVTYTVITDLQLSERSATAVTETTSQSLVQGTAGTREISVVETSNMKRYQTRIMSTANRVNLSLETALPALQSRTVRSIAGLL